MNPTLLPKMIKTPLTMFSRPCHTVCEEERTQVLTIPQDLITVIDPQLAGFHEL